jgi:hypothetical protein
MEKVNTSPFQNFHPHLHVLSTDGCFYNDAAFMVCPPPDTGDLEELFRYEVFKMLKADYSNKSRGLRKKAGTDDAVPALIESEVSSKESRKN